MYSSAGEGNPAEMRCCNKGNRKTTGAVAAGCRRGRAVEVLRGMNGIMVGMVDIQIFLVRIFITLLPTLFRTIHARWNPVGRDLRVFIFTPKVYKQFPAKQSFTQYYLRPIYSAITLKFFTDKDSHKELHRYRHLVSLDHIALNKNKLLHN